MDNRNLYGLVLIGGKSSRMKTDKAVLNYHGKPQFIHAFEFLSSCCPSVFLSLRADQAEQKNFQTYPQIHDLESYPDAGPLAGILSAFERHPRQAWIVLACDLPFITLETLDYLLKNRNPKKLATAFKSSHDGLPEPLFAIYEPNIFRDLKKFYQQGITCPRKILMNSEVELLLQPDKMSLDNINDPDEYKKALKELK